MRRLFVVGGLAVLAYGAVAVTPLSAHEPGSYESPIVEKRVKRFKQNGADIQAVFKKHLPAGDKAAIEAAALRMAAWADEMPDAFPRGSGSVGADDALWDNFPDFKAKAEAMGSAARALKAAAGSGDKASIAAAAKRVGGTCKACHDSYRIKH